MKIGERGQVAIPKKLREKYGLFPNIEVDIKEGPDGVVIQKKPFRISPVSDVYGILKQKKSSTAPLNRTIHFVQVVPELLCAVVLLIAAHNGFETLSRSIVEMEKLGTFFSDSAFVI